MMFEKSENQLIDLYRAYKSMPYIECFDHLRDHPVAYGLTDDLMGEDTAIMVVIKPDASRKAVLEYLIKII